MAARTAHASLWLIAIVSSMGANYRTPNFLITARSAEFVRQVGDHAERFRRDLAMEWLGHELPRWHEPCPISVDASPHLGAGGATSFMFDRGHPFGWTMSIQGSEERILDSVLPHEVTHTIFATHFGGPLPRWADEGACTTVEHIAERAKQQKFLVEFLSTNRGIPFNRMFEMTEYPHDILPLYAQGHSLAQFLLLQGGKQKFIEFVGMGMNSNQWDASVMDAYGYRDLSDLQLTWVDWVRSGSPANVASRSQSDNRQLAALQDNRLGQIASSRSAPQPHRAATPSSGSIQRRGNVQPATLSSSVHAKPSWYANQQNKAASEPRGHRPDIQSPRSRVSDSAKTRSATDHNFEWNSRARIPLEDTLYRDRRPRSPVYFDAPPRRRSDAASVVWVLRCSTLRVESIRHKLRPAANRNGRTT